jgi:hypothetical protein
MPKHISVLVLLACACTSLCQTTPASPNNSGSGQEPTAASETYDDTIRTIKKWTESDENDDLARLFAIGDVRTGDLLAACHDSDEEIAGAAFGALQLLGKPECEPCAESVSQTHGGLAFACSAMGDADFQHIETWMAKKHTGTGYECGEDYEPLMPMGDSVVYALILDGSSRSMSLLDDMLGLEKACVPDGETIFGEVLEQAQSLIVAARKAGHNLRVEPDKLKNSIRDSAFFLPRKYRRDSEVEVIARNKARNRILLEVSYRCGRLCGRGYFVILRKDGADWHYAVIRMAWIS